VEEGTRLKLALYVHDLKLEIGHSNSLIELIRHLPKHYMDKVEEIEVVAFTTSPLENLFPDYNGKLRWVRIPFSRISPVLLKSIYFQFIVFLYNRLFQERGFTRIGIGISSLDVDAVSIQFIHHQWTEKGLEMESGHAIRKMYKKVLFWYFEICERYLFRKRNLKIFSPAEFLTQYLKSVNPELDAVTIYSGVNLSRFVLPEKGKSQILSDLKTRYPVLDGLDVTRPIYIFVGAYERKGLNQALDLLKERPDSQFIVIGSPSLGRTVQWPSSIKVFPITFTREVPLFYALSDVFLFPTIYEPFGLVLFEAMAMGLTIITRREAVGASELLENLPEVYFCDRPSFNFPEVKVKSVEEKKKLRDDRLKYLGEVSWHKAGRELAEFIPQRA
jgi:glycosyltransferase involved in cell wall biosynthesis